MKYSALDTTKEKLLRVGSINKGVDLSRSKIYVDSAALSRGKNVIFCDGAVKTRRGISADESNLITSEFTDDSLYNVYLLSECEFFIDGKYYRIIYEVAEFLSEHSVSFFLIDRDRNTTPIGCMRFARVSDTVFFAPANITFFQGKPQNGAGIFAFVRRTNSYDPTQSLFEVYELNTAMDAWDIVTDFYTPTVYINGRGDMHEASVEAGFIPADDPLMLEPPNMLNGRFYAYFSSDGYSSSFSLPFTDISDDAVFCRIHYSADTYTDWRILAGETSNTQTFMGVDVTMNIDRSKGLVYFTVAAGDYAVPVMSRYKHNNIKITATKLREDDFGDVISCIRCKMTDSRILLSGGIKNNRIYTASYENPLYFPQTNVVEVGESRLPVTALATVKDKLIAFKRDSIYSVTLKKGAAINAESLLRDNDSVFYETDSLSCEPISPDIGCASSAAITYQGGKAVFLAIDGGIYTISPSLSITLISDKIFNHFYNIPAFIRDEARAVSDSKYCYFFTENAVAVCKLGADSQNTECYIWQLPENMRIVGGIKGEDSPILFCYYNIFTCYSAVLDGGYDILLDRKADTMLTSRNIPCSLETAHFSPSGINLTKKLTRVYLTCDFKGNAEIKLNGNKADFAETDIGVMAEGAKRFTVFPEVRKFNSLGINITSDEYLSLQECDIYYSEPLY